jgi:hypothetical protein
MAFLGLFGVLLILALVYAPQFWVGHTMRRHSDERPDFPAPAGRWRSISSSVLSCPVSAWR